MAQGVCPWWLGYFLANPLRRLGQNPRRILAPYVHAGLTALEVGPGMGFFTLALAELVGPQGRAVCVDVQERMLQVLERRTRKAGLAGRVAVQLCSPDSLGVGDLEGRVDFALLFALVHEVPDASHLFAEVACTLKPGGTCLISEPRLHVRAGAFEEDLRIAGQRGFVITERPSIWMSRSAALLRA